MKKILIIFSLILCSVAVSFGQNSIVVSCEEGIINQNDLPEIYISYNLWQFSYKSSTTNLSMKDPKYISNIQLKYTVEPIVAVSRVTYLHGLEYDVTTGRFTFEAFN